MIFWAGFENAIFPYIFQSSRDIAYGSIFGLFITANWDYFSSIFWKGFMSMGSKLLSFMQLIIPLIIYFGYKKFKKFIKSPNDVIKWSLLALSFYIFLSPYHSPQWFVWLLPLLVLLPLNKKEIWIIVIYDLLNFIFFPLIWGFWSHEHILFGVMVFLRTAFLLIIMLIISKKIIHDRHNNLHENLLSKY